MTSVIVENKCEKVKDRITVLIKEYLTKINIY